MSKATSAPMCKLCDVPHWNREPHQFSKSASPKQAPTRAGATSAKAKEGARGKASTSVRPTPKKKGPPKAASPK